MLSFCTSGPTNPKYIGEIKNVMVTIISTGLRLGDNHDVGSWGDCPDSQLGIWYLWLGAGDKQRSPVAGYAVWLCHLFNTPPPNEEFVNFYRHYLNCTTALGHTMAARWHLSYSNVMLCVSN